MPVLSLSSDHYPLSMLSSTTKAPDNYIIDLYMQVITRASIFAMENSYSTKHSWKPPQRSTSGETESRTIFCLSEAPFTGPNW